MQTKIEHPLIQEISDLSPKDADAFYVAFIASSNPRALSELSHHKLHLWSDDD